MLQSYIKNIIILIASSFFVFNAHSKTENQKDFTVIIDAGHGGKDIGATDNGVKEKDINLKVAKYLEALVKKKMKNTKVVMTRDNDSYLTLQQRADVANKSQGDIFISIHTNSVDKRNKNRKNIAGSSVYTLGLHKDENNLEVAMRENSVIELEQDYEHKYSGFDPQRDESYIIFEMAQKRNLAQSIRFAENIEKELEKAGRQNRGVHQAGFWVLWATSMPSVLIELDFICNPESAKYISSDKGAKELAEAIFKALQKYEEAWKKSSSLTGKGELAETYVESSEGLLEDSFTEIHNVPVAKAKVRTHLDKPVKQKSSLRRRRSLSSKELSLNNSFEKEDLFYPNMQPKSFETFEVKEEPAQLLAIEENSNEKSNKKKNDKKKKQEEKKKKDNKKSKKRKDDAYNAKVNKLVTVYKIQILASSDLLSQGNSRFCGLSPITAYKENNLYKYYYGESTDREELESLLTDVRKKIPDAFIVSSQKSIQANK